MGISWCHKAGTRNSCCVAKHTVSEIKKTDSTAEGQSFSETVSPSTMATPINQNHHSSPSLDGNVFRYIAPAPCT